MRRSRNVYGGTCTDCGEHVAPYKGTLSGKSEDGKWLVTHDRCPAAERAEHEARMAELARKEAAMTPLDKLARGFEHNEYAYRYCRMAETVSSREEFHQHMREMGMGMTMDYMTEFVREAAAREFAYAVADERFGKEEK